MASASDGGSDGADFDDWNSDAGDAPVQSLLEPARVVPSAAAAWDELRAASGFDGAAFRRERGALTADSSRDRPSRACSLFPNACLQPAMPRNRDRFRAAQASTSTRPCGS